MISLSDDQPLLDEVLLKIGRNVSNFQKLEGRLKSLLAVNSFGGTAEETKEQVDKRKGAMLKVTFGGLISKFIDEVCVDHPEKETPDEIEDVELHFNVTYSQDPEFKDKLKSELQLLVEERNCLVHHKLGEFDDSSKDSCLELIRFLDAQHEKLRPVYELVERLLSDVKMFGELLENKELKQIFVGG